MFRIASIPFISVLVVFLALVVQGFAPKTGTSIHRHHISHLPPPQSFGIATKNIYPKHDSINVIHHTPSRSCVTTLNAFIGVSSSSETTLWLSQLPQFPQLPTPPTPATIDPTTVLSDVFSTVLGTPLILAIPIVAALLVATLIAYLIVSYASPAEEE
jgi:hypothetical protein